MRVWMKYLIIGWSIISVGILIVSFQIMRSEFMQEVYDINIVYRVPEKDGLGIEWFAEDLFFNKDSTNTEVITKKQFADKMLKAKGVTIGSKTRVDKAIYSALPIHAFFVWSIPTLVFLLVGIIFGRK